MGSNLCGKSTELKAPLMLNSQEFTFHVTVNLCHSSRRKRKLRVFQRNIQDLVRFGDVN